MAQEKIMKAMKRTFIGTSLLGTAFMVMLASYNTMSVDYTAFSRNDLDIKFSKRLDNITGEVTIGRMAASIPKWNKIASKSIEKEVIRIKKQVKIKKLVKAKKELVKAAQPLPVVATSLDLELTGGFYNKKSLKENGNFSGSAKVVNGVIESISLNLPDGEPVDIQTSPEKMVGNVFGYEDTGTGESRTGLFYEVKKGTYMVTLTNDSVYPNMRLELKTDSEIKSESLASNSNWSMDEQKDEYEKIVEEDSQLDIAQTQGIAMTAEEKIQEEKTAMQDQIEELKEQNEILKEEQQAINEEREFETNNEVEQDSEVGSYGFNFQG
jgi:hypothetical protein